MSETASVQNSDRSPRNGSPFVTDQVHYVSSTSANSSTASPPPPPPIHPVILLTTPSPSVSPPASPPASPPSSPPPPPSPRPASIPKSPSPKRRRGPPPPVEDTQCTICFEPLANSGDHQICCMPCGHVFGYNCINQWLRSSSSNRFCPSCKTPGKPRELRYIFGLPQHVSVADQAAIVELQAKLKKEKTAHSITRGRVREYKSLVDALRKQNVQLSRRIPSVQTFGPAAPSSSHRPSRRVSLVTTRVTNGGTTVLAFDDDASFLFPERYSRASLGLRYKITCVPLGQPTLGSVSPHAMEKRVNEIVVCTQPASSFHKYIAVARADKRISVLSPDLRHATDLVTNAIPLSCTWLVSRPHLLMVGLSNGFVSTFDMRNSGQGPLCDTEVAGFGQRALHSIGEVSADSQDAKIVVTASAQGLHAVTFDGYMASPVCSKVSLSDDDPAVQPFICGVTTSDGLMAVTSRRLGCREGHITVYKGLVRSSDGGWGPGPTVGGELTGHMQDLPFCQTALLPGSGDRTGSVVVSGDGGVMCKSRMWEYGSVGKGDRQWKVSEEFLTAGGGGTSLGDVAMVRCARARKLPKTARLPSIPTGTRGVVGCVSDNCIRLYSIGAS